MLTRRKPVKRTRPRPALPPALRAKLAERTPGGWCEANLNGCTGRATDDCHRISAKAGGRPSGSDLRLSNFWRGCRSCHGWATANPDAAYALGLALREHQDPLTVPMAHGDRGRVLLDDEGGLWPFGDAA